MLDSGAADQPLSPSRGPRTNPATRAVERLNSILSRLWLDGLVVVGATLLQLIIVLMIRFPLGFKPEFVTTVVSMVLAGAVLVTVVHHEYLRRLGDALFEEISDEFQRPMMKSVPEESEFGPPPNDLDARVALRSFSSTADLPLIPGKFGPGIYALINIGLLILEFFLIGRPSSLVF